MTAVDDAPATPVPVARCGSTTHGKRPPVATVVVDYLPGYETGQNGVAVCSPCANALAQAGLLDPGRFDPSASLIPPEWRSRPDPSEKLC